MSIMEEKWKPIYGYKGSYEASDMGRIRSLTRNIPIGNCTRLVKGRVLSPSKSKCGYYRVILCDKEGRKKNYYVHRLVLSAFYPTDNDDLQVNHISGIKSDNRLVNLEWVTAGENAIHAFKNGLRGKGEKHVNAVLTLKQVKFVKSLISFFGRKVNLAQLARTMNINYVTLASIKYERTWKHINPQQQHTNL